MRKIIISVAPVSGLEKILVPEKLAEDVIECSKCGASMVHLHVRDKNCRLTKDLSEFKKTVELIKAKSDIIIQASTGGISDLTIEERCAPLYYSLVETASMNIGSVNLGDDVYRNPLPEAKYCVNQIYENNILPDYEVFEIGMINSVLMLKTELALKDPILIDTVLGKVGAMPATYDALTCFRQFIPKDAMWAITHSGRTDFSLITAAISMGASVVRIGFEDSSVYEGDVMAESNAVLVKRLADIIRSIGFEVATPEEARKIFKLTPRK